MFKKFWILVFITTIYLLNIELFQNEINIHILEDGKYTFLDLYLNSCLLYKTMVKIQKIQKKAMESGLWF